MGGHAGGTQAEVPAADPVPAGRPVDAVSFAETRSVDHTGSFLFQTLVFFCGSFQLSKSGTPLPRKKCSPQKVEAKKKRGTSRLHDWAPKSAFEHLARLAFSGGQRTRGPWSQPGRNHLVCPSGRASSLCRTSPRATQPPWKRLRRRHCLSKVFRSKSF